MPEYTRYLNTYKPSRADSIDVDVSLAQNFQIIDDKLGSALAKGETTYSSLGKRFEEIEILLKKFRSINVKDFGAVGNGTTDDTQAFIDAQARATELGGATIEVPKGDYLIDGRIEVRDNTTWLGENGAVLMKKTTATSAHVFVIGMEHGTKGYGGGAKNVGFYNLTFKGWANGASDYRALANTFNHAQNVIISNCQFVDCITSAHALDLGGCDNILIEKCIFAGAYNLTDREYTEAIQIDSSTATALGDPAFTNMDSLPTKNVVVRDCKFIPSYNANGTVKNYAPNPIGNHGFTGGMYYEGIVFENNLVYDGWEQTGSNWRAWIHFYALKDSKFINNRFINPRGVKCSPLGFYTSSAGRYNPTTGEAETGTPVACKNIEIAGNLFEGFSYSGSGVQALIRAYGSTYNSVIYRVTNFSIHDNQFTGNGTSAMTQDAGPNLIQFDRFTDLSIKDNKADLGARLASVYTGWNFIFDGNLASRMSSGMLFLDGVDVTSIKGNVAANLRRPLEITECRKLSIKDNTFDDVKQTNSENYANKFRNLNGVIIQGNYTGTASGLENGYYVYDTDGSSNWLKVYDNMAVGFTNEVYTTGTLLNYKFRS